MREGERKVKGAKKEQRERERGSPYLASVEYKLNEMHDDASTDVLHAELLPKLMTHREGYSWLNEFLDEQKGEGEGGREGGRGGGGREGTKGGGGRGKRRGKKGRGKGEEKEEEGEEEDGQPSCGAVVLKGFVTFSWPREDSSPLLMVA